MFKKQLETIEVNKLTINPIYQRLLTKSYKDITKNFNEKKLGEITLSYRDFKFYIIDGHNRAEACKKIGIKKIDSVIYFGLTLEEEAELFVALNTNTSVKRNDKFKAKLVYKDAQSIAINDIAIKNNFKISNETHKSIDNCIRAVEALEFAYKLDNGITLDLTLKTIFEAWNGQKESVHQRIIRPMAMFLNKYPEIDIDELKTKLINYDPSVISRRGTEITRLLGGGTYENSARAILNIYNSSKRKNKLEDRFIKNK